MRENGNSANFAYIGFSEVRNLSAWRTGVYATMPLQPRPKSFRRAASEHAGVDQGHQPTLALPLGTVCPWRIGLLGLQDWKCNEHEGSDSLGHHALGVRVDDPVLLRDEERGRQRAPGGRNTQGVGEAGGAGPLLNDGHNRSAGVVHVLGKY